MVTGFRQALVVRSKRATSTAAMGDSASGVSGMSIAASSSEALSTTTQMLLPVARVATGAMEEGSLRTEASVEVPILRLTSTVLTVAKRLTPARVKTAHAWLSRFGVGCAPRGTLSRVLDSAARRLNWRCRSILNCRRLDHQEQASSTHGWEVQRRTALHTRSSKNAATF